MLTELDMREQFQSLYKHMQSTGLRVPYILPGIVVSNVDPTRKAKLQIRVPLIHGDGRSIESIQNKDLPFAYPALPLAGKTYGFTALPQIGDAVWVMFFLEDIRTPIWLGCYYGEEDSHPEHVASYSPNPSLYGLRSPRGSVIHVDDSPVGEFTGVLLKDFREQEVRLNAKTNTASIVAGILSATLTTSATIVAGATTGVVGMTFLITATSVFLGVQAAAQKLCNETFLALFNAHFHIGTDGPTGPPTIPAVPGTHSTVNTSAS